RYLTHTVAVESNTESNAEAGQEEPANDDKEDPHNVEEQSVVDVDLYNNNYYAHDDEKEHMFALTKHQGDRCVPMQCVTLQKAADKLQWAHYTPQEKECLVTYVEVNEHPAWTLWDSRGTTMGIMPQFAHVNAIHVHELTEPFMLQLGTVGSCAVVQFGVEVKVKVLGQPMKEYVDIANFNRYNIIIGMLFMHKNKVKLDFVNNQVVINGTLLRAERIVLADTDRWLWWYRTTEKHCNGCD
ncbi:hypothetical protein C0992_000528, partial [Termitomyces sp. T32_za158]